MAKKQVDALGGSWIAFFLTFERLFCGGLHTKDVNSGGWYVKKGSERAKSVPNGVAGDENRAIFA